MDNPLIRYLLRLRAITEEDQAIIINAFEKKSFKEGKYLLPSNRISRQLFFISKGILRIVIRNDKGVEVTHYFLKEDQFCTILNSFKNEVVAEESIQAACDAEVLVISKTRLMELYRQLPYLQVLIDQIIQQGLLDKIRIRNTYLGQDAATRYQLFLTRQPEIAQRVSLGDIASYLGITPQSLSRIRKNTRH